MMTYPLGSAQRGNRDKTGCKIRWSLDRTLSFHAQKIRGELLDRFLYRKFHGCRGSSTAMTTSNQSQVRYARPHTQEFNIAAVGFHIWSHLIQRLLHAAFDVIRMQSMQEQQMREQFILFASFKQLRGLLLSLLVHQACKALAVEFEERLNTLDRERLALPFLQSFDLPKEGLRPGNELPDVLILHKN